jgi:hypothetical protein
LAQSKTKEQTERLLHCCVFNAKNQPHRRIDEGATDSTMKRVQEHSPRPGWFAPTPAKAASEKFFLLAAAFWITIFGGVVVTEIYKV